MQNKKIELLAPAGNPEKLEIAIHFGADAVYLGGKSFSLRNLANNFTLKEIEYAVATAHARNVKVYVACNIYPRTGEERAIRDYLGEIGKIGPDAVILADPGVVMAARETIPHIPIHLSTQANTTSLKAALFWKNLGIQRINVARELPLDEIREIVAHSGMEIEAFVHGAMCISYSGRCLLSNFMARRDSNRGMCSHPCRWKYAVVEELRPGKYMPLAEDEHGSYIFNSEDLCMIDHIPALSESGLCALKIEGRMKGIHYLASVLKVYRDAIDTYYRDPVTYQPKPEWLEELRQVNYRGYSTGFYFNEPDRVLQNYENTTPNQEFRFAGKVIATDKAPLVTVEVRNKIFNQDTVQIISRKVPVSTDTVSAILSPEGHSLDYAQPGMIVDLRLETPCQVNDLIRKCEEGSTFEV